MTSTSVGFVLTFLTGSAGALYSLNYKLKERKAYPTDPVMFFFSVAFILVTTAFRLAFREPIYSREALLLGVPFGISMHLSLRLYFRVAQRAKLNISWMIIQFSLLVPFGLSILVYRETLESMAILGVALIFVSILFFALGKGSSGPAAAIPDTRTWLLLILSSLFSGIGMSVPRVYIALSPGGGAFTLAFYQGLTLLVLSAAALFLRRKNSSWKNYKGMLLISFSMGLTSVPTTALITLALRYLRGAIVFPLRSVINILCVFILSFLLFKERVRTIEAIGSLIALAGIVLVSTALS
ncbi:MAG: EamA family transporter [Spirochaetales bacterium]|nr:EamA family transporter [Spirochaetales bacterium]